MTDSKPNTLQAQFADRCTEFLHGMIEDAQNEDSWDRYLGLGAGEQAIAGGHEERHILELLQNARDAIYRARQAGEGGPGRVFVAVTEHGMAMANTGDPFHLNDDRVLKAVRFLQRSDKDSRGFIGHKGVGLKSILLRAGAFSVRSRVDGHLLRTTFSRSRTAEYLLRHVEQNGSPISAEQARYIRQQLPRIPLFVQPHADLPNGEYLGEDTSLVEAFFEGKRTHKLELDSNGNLTSLAPYTTVVYLPYRDERWEQLLKTTEKQLSSNDLTAFKRAKRQTGTISDRANADDVWQELVDLDRRVLVLLGEIQEIHFARFKDGALQNLYRIEVESPLSTLNEHRESRPRRITVREHRWSSDKGVENVTERSFIVLSTPTELGVVDEGTSEDQEPHEHIRILLELPNLNHPRLKNERLFLYYPIETELSGLPFLVHGPFRVNPSRTALVKSQAEHNRAVLEEAITLLRRQLPTLLDEAQEIRSWLPWIVLPLLDPDTPESAAISGLQVELCKKVIDLLVGSASVPTINGLARPEEVHFFPQRPDALRVLEDIEVNSGNQDTQLRLLTPESHESYRTLYHANGDRLSQAAQRIGLGSINLRAFAEALVSHLGQSNEDIHVDQEFAKEFFLNLCDLFSEADSSKTAKEAAEIMGRHRAPLLPAFPGNTDRRSEKLLLVPAEARRSTPSEKSEKLSKASRVVFWRPANVESRFKDMPVPPSSVIPVYFMPPSIIRAEGARAEGILSTFYDEWGTTRFESRPDLFRRVADRAVEIPGDETVLPILGYLSRLLHRITSESYTGAEDLQPRPYAAIGLATLRRALHQYGSTSRRQYWERLESLQQWAHIQVPVRGTRGFAPAEMVVFGPAWADVLREFVSHTESDEGEDIPPEERWAEAIDKLADFREGIGHHNEDGQYPELAPPDDERWDHVRQHLQQEASLSGPIEESKAIFDLLLLLGVRIGPRVEWRWLNRRKGASRFDTSRRSINREASRELFAGRQMGGDVPDILRQMTQSALARAYCKHVTLKPYHTKFSGGHSAGCRKNIPKKGDGGSALAAWIWFPDLIDDVPDTLPLTGQRAQVDAFREAIVAVWASLSERVLKAGWYCCRNWHAGRRWEKPIPSLAAFQLSQLDLWPSMADSHIPGVEQRRFPASVMVAWEKEDPPSANDVARFFPLLDIRENPWATIAQDLQVDTLAEISFRGAVSRLRWLLGESRTNGEAPAGCWPISEFGQETRNAWLAAQYRLLARIVDENPDDAWCMRTVLINGLTLRAVRDDDQIAVPVVTGEAGEPQFPQDLDLAYFSQSPRYWEREQHAHQWILTTRSQLQRKLYRWAKALGAERIPPSDPPAYTGATIEAPEAVKALRREVGTRLSLLLGVFKAHQAEKLEEMARTVLDALETLRAVEPDAPDEAGSSGLDGEKRLVFSYPAYERADEASQAVVLAEGIALLVNQTTAVGDLQNALGAPRRQVELALRFRGIDLDDIIKDVSALARDRFLSLLKRIDRLVQALSAATGASVPPPISQRVNESVDERSDWMQAIESLEALEGSTAAEALDGIRAVASDLPRRTREKLLRETIDEALSETMTIRHLLALLREANWSLEKRRAFAESDIFEGSLKLQEQREAIDATLNVAITGALIDHLRVGELDSVEDPLHELNKRARDMRARLVVRATDRSSDFIQHLHTELDIPMTLEPPDLLVLEWEEETWSQLTRSLQDRGTELLPEVPEDLRGLLARCLEQSTLTPLQESHYKTLDERQRRVRELERRLDQRTLLFNPQALTGGSPPEGEPSAETRPPGESGGGLSNGVTSDQAVRGRVAELFVLQACWVRFLNYGKEDRERILDAILSRRRDGSGEGTDHVQWSTKVAWRDLNKRLEQRREALTSCSQDITETPDELMKLFKDLIEVANERGPGYDVLDPFGVWGAAPEQEVLDPRRVEIKAILHDSEEDARYRIVLSTNEFHRASRDPKSYVLRLISVPREPERNISRVHWICDIPDPVQRLKLREQIGKGVRGGTLPLLLQIERAENG